MVNPTVWCGGCKTEHREHTMQIYIVSTNKYFCDQACADAYYGLIRDAAGDVVDMVEQYIIKQKFKDEEHDSPRV